MEPDYLRIPKEPVRVTLWIHPEGRVAGALFLSYQGENMRLEEPVAVLNQGARFIVLKRDEPDEIRFYNKASIVRVQYEEEDAGVESVNHDALDCTLYMMDGSLIRGVIRRMLPPDHARLYDYLNLDDERFIKIHVGAREVCLVNKAYVVRATQDTAG